MIRSVLRTWAGKNLLLKITFVAVSLTVNFAASDINICCQDAMDEYNRLRNIKKVRVGNFLWVIFEEHLHSKISTLLYFFSQLTTGLKRRGVNISGLSCLTSRGGSVNMTTALKSFTTFGAGEEASACSHLFFDMFNVNLPRVSLLELRYQSISWDVEERGDEGNAPALELFRCMNFYFLSMLERLRSKASGMVFFVFYWIENDLIWRHNKKKFHFPGVHVDNVLFFLNHVHCFIIAPSLFKRTDDT